tara:strand:+ start:5384 stop:6730 length:1347 start_codon:yes stop_codon:yes gene_type:complete
MATWTIKYNAHGKFVTCQRPIVFTLKVTAGAVAHFRGSLYIKNSLGNFIDTGVEFNAYPENDINEFSCNAAEYCRDFFIELQSFYNPNQWCLNFNDMVEREFHIVFYPVEYDASGNLIPDPTDTKTSVSFLVSPTSTEARESTSSLNDNIRMDKFILNGGNSSSAPWFSSAENRLLSNMPAYNTVDTSQGFFYFYNALLNDVAGRQSVLEITNGAGTVQTLDLSAVTGYLYLHLHPLMIDFMLSLSQGVMVNFLTDAAGNLLSPTVKLQIKFNDDATGVFIRSSPQMKVAYKDGMGCRSKTFVFRNMRGGFDHFTATGTQDRSVELTGTDFDRHTNFDRADSTFDLLRGQHNITNLWNSKKEIYSIFSQKVTKEYAIWLEELIISPQVWVIEDVKDYQNSNPSLGYENKGLVAVNILKGSFNVINTENNMHYIEFKYSLSENTITQKM